jgi:toxin-antitoxin system PIN domain toxin
MIAPDANLLIYANSPTSPFYSASRRWLEQILSSSEPVGIPLLSVYAFLRFVTNDRIASRPLTFLHACAVVDTWLAVPHVQLLYPGERHWLLLQQLAEEVPFRGAHVTDAAIAAIAIEYGATVHTNDRDFARFPGLRWFNPIRP